MWKTAFKKCTCPFLNTLPHTFFLDSKHVGMGNTLFRNVLFLSKCDLSVVTLFPALVFQMSIGHSGVLRRLSNIDGRFSLWKWFGKKLYHRCSIQSFFTLESPLYDLLEMKSFRNVKMFCWLVDVMIKDH